MRLLDRGRSCEASTRLDLLFVRLCEIVLFVLFLFRGFQRCHGLHSSLAAKTTISTAERSELAVFRARGSLGRYRRVGDVQLELSAEYKNRRP